MVLDTFILMLCSFRGNLRNYEDLFNGSVKNLSEGKDKITVPFILKIHDFFPRPYVST